jgi:hypothetical protein
VLFSSKKRLAEHSPQMRAVAAVIPVLAHYRQVLPHDIGRLTSLTELCVFYERDKRVVYGVKVLCHNKRLCPTRLGSAYLSAHKHNHI